MKRCMRSGVLLILLLCGCGRKPWPAAPSVTSSLPSPIAFTDVARAAGLRFHHTNGASGRFYMPETLGSGGAFLDYDRDGHPDIFLVNGAPLPGSPRSGPPPTQALYHNRGDGTFAEVTRPAGLAVTAYGMGCAAADYDNDGYPDLYLSALGPDHLFHNNRDGTFSDVTKRAEIDAPEWNTSAVWLDYDRDGRLDLYVCGYIRWSPALNRPCPDARGHPHMCTPELYQGVSSRLFHNRGDGTFADVTTAAGVREPTGKALAALAWDAEDDGWPDLLVANDLEPNLLLRNHKDGTFREVGAEAGFAFSNAGKARAGMGLDSGDLAGTGREAVLVGNFSGEGLGLYAASAGPGESAGNSLADIADSAGLAPASLRSLTFGVLFGDFDRDGRPDLLTANGHIDPNVALSGRGISFRQRPQLFHQEDGGRFQDVTATAGPGLQRAGVYRGLAMADFDGDGDPDVLVSENGGTPLLLRNDSRGGYHGLQVRLQGTRSNRDGIGARVRVTAAGQPGAAQTRWIRAGSGYASSSEPVAFFGLGPATEAARVEIRWPAGTTQIMTHVPADQGPRVMEEPRAAAP